MEETPISENPSVSATATTEVSEERKDTETTNVSDTEILEKPSVADLVISEKSNVEEVSETPNVEQNHGKSASEEEEMLDNGDMDSQLIFSEEEVRNSLETSASTGKFWQDWERLRSILSYYLKQVLSEYPEAKMTSEQQISSLGMTYEELVKRLDDALRNFDEGPPFTLQRLCEILLSARSIYPKLSKLSLALEKNLLVTSMLTICNDPYPPVTEQNPNGSHEVPESDRPETNSVENAVQEPATGDRDEIMTEVEDAGTHEDMTIDMETMEEIVKSSEANSMEEVVKSSEANPMEEVVKSSEAHPMEEIVKSSEANPTPNVDS